MILQHRAPNERSRRGEVRAPGLLVLILVVAAGLGAGAVYYRYKAPRLAAEMEARIAAAPKTPEGRLEQWLLFGGAQVHHRLTKFGRFSSEHPWLVTHAIDLGDGSEPELWGIDCEGLPRELAHIEGLTVVVELPAPRALGRAPLVGDAATFVPVVEPGEVPPDPSLRLHQLALHLLDRIPEALANDIEGASLEVRVGASEG